MHGLGFYAHYYQQSAARQPHADFLPALSAARPSTLVIKGRCDYLSWSSAVAYRRALPATPLVYLQGSGHNAYQDEPEKYMATVRAFLLNRRLPEVPYNGEQAPHGYEGPS